MNDVEYVKHYIDCDICYTSENKIILNHNNITLQIHMKVTEKSTFLPYHLRDVNNNLTTSSGHIIRLVTSKC